MESKESYIHIDTLKRALFKRALFYIPMQQCNLFLEIPAKMAPLRRRISMRESALSDSTEYRALFTGNRALFNISFGNTCIQHVRFDCADGASSSPNVEACISAVTCCMYTRTGRHSQKSAGYYSGLTKKKNPQKSAGYQSAYTQGLTHWGGGCAQIQKRHTKDIPKSPVFIEQSLLLYGIARSLLQKSPQILVLPTFEEYSALFEKFDGYRALLRKSPQILALLICGRFNHA